MSVLCFGDFLMHFSPLSSERFMQCNTMNLSFTGAEANVCAALSLWGENTRFITKLPKHELSKKGISFLKSLNINTDFISFGGERMGIYFLENGVSLRHSNVIYDRNHTAFTNSEFEDYDFCEALKGVKILYLSGITPALSENLLECSKKLLKKAREKNIDVFFDVNFRPTLCSIQKASENFYKLSPYITHLISNKEHLKMLTGIDSKFTENEQNEILKDLSVKVHEITKIKNIAITVRRTLNASKAVIWGSLFNGKEFTISNNYNIDVVDRVGSGDSFSAGLIYSYMNDFDINKSVEFSVASSALKHTIMGDINFSTPEEIEEIINSKSFDVKR